MTRHLLQSSSRTSFNQHTRSNLRQQPTRIAAIPTTGFLRHDQYTLALQVLGLPTSIHTHANFAFLAILVRDSGRDSTIYRDKSTIYASEMPKGLKIVRADGNPMTIHQWRRNSRSDYDDILTGYQRNEDLGWYKEVVDPNGQKKATQDLIGNGIAQYDWAYHERK